MKPKRKPAAAPGDRQRKGKPREAQAATDVDEAIGAEPVTPDEAGQGGDAGTRGEIEPAAATKALNLADMVVADIEEKYQLSGGTIDRRTIRALFCSEFLASIARCLREGSAMNSEREEYGLDRLLRRTVREIETARLIVSVFEAARFREIGEVLNLAEISLREPKASPEDVDGPTYWERCSRFARAAQRCSDRLEVFASQILTDCQSVAPADEPMSVETPRSTGMPAIDDAAGTAESNGQACDQIAGMQRPAWARDRHFLRLSREGKTAGMIRDDWNAMSDDDRKRICPGRWGRIADRSKGDGRRQESDRSGDKR